MSWFKRLLGIEATPRGLVITTEIETPTPRSPRAPKPATISAPALPPVPASFPPPEGDYRFLALDVETANHDMASICQIGIATVSQSGEVRSYSTLIDPRCKFVFTSIHGIDAKMVRGAPTFADVFPILLPILYRHTIFQHSSFDQRAVDAAHAAMGVSAPKLRWLDSVRVARQAWPEFSGAGGHGLSHLKKALKLDFQHHDAGEDARAAAQVVLLAEERLGATFDQIVVARAPARTRARPTFAPTVSLEGAADGPLSGGIAVFTGELSIPREDAAARAAAMGISVRTSVSRKTTFVIVGGDGPASASPTGKHRRALDLAAEGATIAIIGEAEFLALLSGETAPPPPIAQQARRPGPVPTAAPRPVGDDKAVVVLSGALTSDPIELAARAEAAGMTVMTNVTRRTMLVVVADADLVIADERKTTRHRSAEAAIARGQALRVVGETEFLAMIGIG